MRRRLALLAFVLAGGALCPAGILRGQGTPADSARLLRARGDTAAARQTETGVRDAIAHWAAAAALYGRGGARSDEGQMLHLVGRSHANLGAPDSALLYLGRALAIRREAGPPNSVGATLGTIGSVYRARGLADSALRYYRQALAVQRETRDRLNEGRTLTNIGTVHERLGHVDSTLRQYRLALAIQRDVQDRAGEGQTLVNLGAVYGNLGRADSALHYYREALAIQRAANDRRGEGTSLGNLGSLHAGVGRRDSALFYYERALAIHRERGDRSAAAATLANIGVAHGGAGRPDSALRAYRDALAVARETGDRAVEGAALNNIGALRADAGEPDSAASYYDRALATRRAAGDRRGEAATLANIGRLHLERGPAAQRDPARAVVFFDSAAAALGAIRAGAGGDANAISLAELGRDLFRRWTLAELARGDAAGRGAARALAVADRGRAQALSDLLRASAERASAERTPAGARANAVPRPGADLAAEADSLLAPLRRDGTAALSYLVTADTLVAWLALPSGAVHVWRTAVLRDSLDALVRAVRGDLDRAPAAPVLATRALTLLEPAATPAAPDVGTGALAGLGALLLPTELRALLPAKGDLVVVPHAALAVVPFGALPVGPGGPPLGTRFAMRFAHSLAALAAVEALPTPRLSALAGEPRRRALAAALVIGNPVMPRVPGAAPLERLPAAEREARALAARIGARARVGSAATESAARAALGGAPLVHFATHGFAYSTDARARDSFVALAADSAGDGLLTVGEVLDDRDLRLVADLVVLSACQTGLGSLMDAEGTVGLARAFLAKGARSVLVSLWSVSDEATELLMRRFYAHWLDDADRPSKGEALRRAQGDVRRAPGLAHPRYWAAFQLVGAR